MFLFIPQALALVVKYSDSLYKGFGNSIAIVIANSCIGFLYQDVTLNARYGAGSLLVLLSSAAYYTLTSATTSHSEERSSSSKPIGSASASLAVAHSSGFASANAYVIVNSAQHPSNLHDIDAAEKGSEIFLAGSTRHDND